MMVRSLVLAAALLIGPGNAAAQGVQVSVRLETAAAESSEPQSGRLLIFAQRVEPSDAPPPSIDASPFRPTETAIIGRDLKSFAPNTTVMVDAETDVFPLGFSALEPGQWRLQAVLDRNGDYGHAGRSEGDLVSDIVETHLPGPVPTLVLSRSVAAQDFERLIAQYPEAEQTPLRTALARSEEIDFVSPRLSAFWGRPIQMRGWVALPPGYSAKSRTTYPVIYWTHGFDGNSEYARWEAAKRIRSMERGELPPMIWVMLDQSSASGTHEFADSVNNGPWGTALTQELIPMLEQKYRMDGRPNGRFLTGHSSGGWAALWLQTRYPRMFGGAWATAPDASDFHDFTGADIYRANANVYKDANGRPIPLVRFDGQVTASFRDFARIEAALGPVGGQLASLEWVFSPRGADGRALPLFDRQTGAVDPMVAAYWRENYDIAHIVRRDWAQLRPYLKGKIRVIVGEADNFHLDQSARLLQAVLDELEADARFTFVPGGTHFRLCPRADGNNSLMQEIASEIYEVARPGSGRKPNADGSARAKPLTPPCIK